MCHRKGGLYIYLPSESNGPNLLDDPLKGFIVTPACSPWKCFVTPGFKDKAECTPYVSPGNLISHIATNEGQYQIVMLNI